MSEHGFTLLEVIVVMGIFMAIIIISSEAFKRIISVSSQQTKSAESDTQGIVGLEMMRVDMQHAGYGLPWRLDFVAEFDESQSAVDSLAPGINSKLFNDKYNKTSDANKTPRAIQARAAVSTVYAENGRDYLVIKSILAGMNDTVRKWSYVEGVGAASVLKEWGSAEDLAANEIVVTLDSRTKRLVADSVAADHFSYAITTAHMTPPDAPANFRPQNDMDVYVVYGVSPATALRVPYNRVDYYVKRPAAAADIPARCAPGTGILYKAVMSHADGLTVQYPLLECVADMQVVFSLDTNGDGGVDAHFDENGLSDLTAKEIRQQLKEIRVYIASHEGGKDTSFQYASPTLEVGDFALGRTLDLNELTGSEYKNYRWKIYRLVVSPKNIIY